MVHNIFNFFIKTTTTTLVIDPISDIKDTYNNIHTEIMNGRNNYTDNTDDKDDLMEFIKTITPTKNSPPLLSSIHEQFTE
jgi:hypothetical protein